MYFSSGNYFSVTKRKDFEEVVVNSGNYHRCHYASGTACACIEESLTPQVLSTSFLSGFMVPVKSTDSLELGVISLKKQAEK